MDVNAIETFDDAKIVGWICHVHLELCFVVECGFMVLSANDKIINLAKNKDKFFGGLVSLVVETMLVGTSFES